MSLSESEYSSLEVLINSRFLAVASFTAFLYDYCLTFPDEVEYFWQGSGGILQLALFVLNRYIPFIVSPFTLTVFVGEHLSVSFCKITSIRVITSTFLCQTVIAQGILVIRVFFMYTFSRPVQLVIITCFAVSVTLCVVFTVSSLQVLPSENHLPDDMSPVAAKIGGCQTPQGHNPGSAWRNIITSFTFHVVVFILTTARAFRQQRLPLADGTVRSIRKRLIQDGGFWYILILLAAGWTALGATLNFLLPSNTVPAMYSGFMQNMISISISRVMLSIRSLAASLTFDPPWIFNASELTRVHLGVGRSSRRTGNNVLVELAESDPASFLNATGTTVEPRIGVSRTGVLDDYHIASSMTDGRSVESSRFRAEAALLMDPEHSAEIIVIQ